MESSEFTSQEIDSSSSPILIAHGGTCDLYRLKIHNKFHVLKQLKREHCNSPQHIESLRREFEIGFQLDHSNIIRYLKYDSNNADPSILLEFIDGTSVLEAITEHTITLSVEIKKKIILQLCNAVDYLHSKQIYHLDIKPNNLMITFRSKNLKLIDFGHAVSDGDVNIAGGTKNYMPPEQSNNIYDTSNDVYSIGKVIKFIFSNERDDIRQKWIPIISKCLAVDPNDRFESISSLNRSIDKLDEKSYTKQILIGTISIAIVGSLVYLFIALSTDISDPVRADSDNIGQKPIDSETIDSGVVKAYKGESNLLEPAETKIVFKISDSIYCTNLGISLYESFLKNYNQSDKSNQSGSKIHSQVIDSVQAEWFKYVNKFESFTIEYKQAYDIYARHLNESQTKIMNLLYASE